MSYVHIAYKSYVYRSFEQKITGVDLGEGRLKGGGGGGWTPFFLREIWPTHQPKGVNFLIFVSPSD